MPLYWSQSGIKYKPLPKIERSEWLCVVWSGCGWFGVALGGLEWLWVVGSGCGWFAVVLGGLVVGSGLEWLKMLTEQIKLVIEIYISLFQL